MPMYATVGGVQRELSAVPVTVDGVQRELELVNAAVAGVQREVFSALSRWEKHAVRHYFGAYSSSGGTSIYDDETCERYLSSYQESGTVTVSGADIKKGQYVNFEGADWYVSRPYNENNSPVWGWLYPITSYTTAADPTVIEVVQSSDASAYPENGEQDGYWYVKI